MNTIGTFSLRSPTLSFRRNLHQELESQNSTFIVNKPPALVAVIPGPLYPPSLVTNLRFSPRVITKLLWPQNPNLQVDLQDDA